MSAALETFCRAALPVGLALLLQSGVLLALGLSAGWLLRRRGPACRAFVCRMTLAGVALGALLSTGLAGHVRPVWSIGIPPARSGSPPPPAGEGVLTVARASTRSSPAPDALSSPERGGGEPERAGGVLDAGGITLASLPVVLWAAVSGLLLLWLTVCRWHLTALERRAVSLTFGRSSDVLARLAAAQHVQAPRLLASPAVRSPFLAGIRRPVIFLPAAWEGALDDTALHVVLAHELAHLRRRDCAWTLLLRLTTALLWPQPLLWLLARQLDQATEEACDLMALAPDCPPRRYADCLLRLASLPAPAARERTLGMGITPVRSSLGRRIQNVLDRRNHAMTPLSVRLHIVVKSGIGISAAGLSLALAPPQARPSLSHTPGTGLVLKQAEPLQARILDEGAGGERLGYGITWGPSPKFMREYWTGYWLSAIQGSPAARAGIPAGPSALVSINGRSVSKASQKAVAALFRLPPPLHITYMTPQGQTRQATLNAKADLTVPALTNTLSTLLAWRKSEQISYSTAQYWLGVLEKQQRKAGSVGQPGRPFEGAHSLAARVSRQRAITTQHLAEIEALDGQIKDTQRRLARQPEH